MQESISNTSRMWTSESRLAQAAQVKFNRHSQKKSRLKILNQLMVQLKF